jgi:hypothetical protein
MIGPNLLLKYKIEGDNRVHIRGAARIKVDGCGALMLYATVGGTAESVSLGSIQSLSIYQQGGYGPQAAFPTLRNSPK